MSKSKSAKCVKDPSGGEERVRKFHVTYSTDAYRFETDLPGVNSTWAPTKLVALYRLGYLGDQATHDEIAEQLGVDRSTVTRKLSSMDWGDFEGKLDELCSMSVAEYDNGKADIERWKALRDDGTRARERHISNLAALEHIRQGIASNTPILELPPYQMKAKSRRSTRTPEHVVLLLSDLHVGQQFTREETGINEYNPEVFVKRAARLRDSLVDIYGLHSELYELPELHVLCLGDMVQGTNTAGEWGCAYNVIGIDEQARMATHAISDMVSTWSTCFNKVTVHGVVGNHGRAGAKNTERVSANWDNVVFDGIQARMARHSNVQVLYDQRWWRQTNINGTEFMMVHGDHVKGNINGLRKVENDLQGQLCGRSGRYFNVLCMGHFHSHYEIETTRGKVLVNGSFVGGDVFSMHTMKTNSRPSQTIMGVHPDYGITWKYSLDLDGVGAQIGADTEAERVLVAR